MIKVSSFSVSSPDSCRGRASFTRIPVEHARTALYERSDSYHHECTSPSSNSSLSSRGGTPPTDDSILHPSIVFNASSRSSGGDDAHYFVEPSWSSFPILYEADKKWSIHALLWISSACTQYCDDITVWACRERAVSVFKAYLDVLHADVRCTFTVCDLNSTMIGSVAIALPESTSKQWISSCLSCDDDEENVTGMTISPQLLQQRQDHIIACTGMYNAPRTPQHLCTASVWLLHILRTSCSASVDQQKHIFQSLSRQLWALQLHPSSTLTRNPKWQALIVTLCYHDAHSIMDCDMLSRILHEEKNRREVGLSVHHWVMCVKILRALLQDTTLSVEFLQKLYFSCG